jgi:hypothetical protein
MGAESAMPNEFSALTTHEWRVGRIDVTTARRPVTPAVRASPPETGTQMTVTAVSSDPLGWLGVTRNATRPLLRRVAFTMRPTTGSGEGVAATGPATGELPTAFPAIPETW